MTPYEKNCAVAEKLGYYALLHENMDTRELAQLKRNCGDGAVYVQETNNDSFYDKDYCNNPSDYMPLAIEYGISILQADLNDTVSCKTYRNDGKLIKTDWLPKSQTGHAVVDAFLQI